MDYLVHSGRPNTGSRLVSASFGGQDVHRQFICGSSIRLVPTRPVQLSEETIKSHLDELRMRAGKGLIHLTTLDRRVVDLETFAVAPAAPVPPLPKPLLDSAANDKPGGSFVNPFQEPAPPKEFTMPVEAPAAALEDNPVVAPVEETPVEDVATFKTKRRSR